MSAVEDPGTELTPAEWRDLRRLAAFMVAASALRTASRSRPSERTMSAKIASSSAPVTPYSALAMLREIAGGDFACLDETKAEAAAMTLLGREGPVVTALGRAVLQCYYRDDRVMRALGLEPRPPYPKGRVLEEGDWSLLDAVRGRKRMWRDVDGAGK
jgi:hypothetical protein